MRCVPQPVVIITSTDVSTGEPVFRGATISSFNTVTLDPTTIVSLNMKRPSSTFDAITSSGYFLAHLLSAHPTIGDIAQAFTKGSSYAPFQTLEGVSQIQLPEDPGQIAGLNAGPPVIHCPTPGHLLCRYLRDKTVEVGDHVVIFGTVDRVTGKEWSDTTCLAYANGRYGRVIPLEQSPALEITKTAFDDFVQKLTFMNHGCLNARTFSNIHLDRFSPELMSSFTAFRQLGHKLFLFLEFDKTFKVKSNPSSMDFGKPQLSLLSHGILEAITFYRIFLEPTNLTSFVTYKLPRLPSEAVAELQKYEVIANDTDVDCLGIGSSILKRGYPNSSYQPPVTAFYSLEKMPSVSIGEKFHYLNQYIRYCLPPLVFTVTKGSRGHVLLEWVSRYNATQIQLKDWMYYEVRRLDDPFASRSTPAHAHARAAIMAIPRKAILLLEGAKLPTRKVERLENLSTEFPGLDDRLMVSLMQYSAICETTLGSLNHYKAFLHASELDSFERVELDGSPEQAAPKAVLHSEPRKVKHSDVTIKPHFTKPPPLVRKYTSYSSTGSTRTVPRPLVVRKTVVEPTPAKVAEDTIKIRFADHIARRRLDLAERREASIQSGLADIEMLMADERRLRRGGIKDDGQSPVAEDGESSSSKAHAKPSSLAQMAEGFFAKLNPR